MTDGRKVVGHPGRLGRSLRAAALLVVGLAVLAVVLKGCMRLPKLDGRTPSAIVTDTSGTALGRAVAGWSAGVAGASGIHPLEKPLEAFAARVALARTAERSLDVQYYIWHDDTTGLLLFEELWSAAERGVRVRLLLDDNNTGGMDEIIAALDGHAGIEVRLFNPFVYRGSRLLGYLADFRRLNHRMHNKSLTADNQATIVGGRNVGDEYFASGGHVVFQDLDVIGVGPVAAAVGADFDRYWNSGSAYPAGVIIARTKAGGTGELSRLFAQTRASAEASRYREAVAATTLVSDLLAHRLSLDWATTTLISDKPEKVAGQVQDQDLLFSRLLAAIGTPRREIDLISPYFVPGERGAADLATYPGRGVKLRIVTNSLAATDVGAVHAGYARRREALLRGGARIYELKPGAAATTRRGDRERHSAPGGSAGGSSTVSLHAKTFAVDRERVFVGSFNLDPRSARLNTEMGVLIDSPSLAGAVSNALDAKAALLSWEVVLGADGKRLAWVEQTPQGPVRHAVEPETGFFKRLGVRLMSLLPVEAML